MSTSSDADFLLQRNKLIPTKIMRGCESANEVKTCRAPPYPIITPNSESLLKLAQDPSLTENTWHRDWVDFFPQQIANAEIVMSQILNMFDSWPSEYLSPSRHEHIIVDFQDGGCSCFQIYYPVDKSELKPNTPVIVISPAGTNNQDAYINSIQQYNNVYGWIVVVVNRRGLCEKLTTPKFYAMGCDSDLQTIFYKMQQRAELQNSPWMCLSFSVGGNYFNRFLGRYASSLPKNIIASSSACAPCDINDYHPRSSLFAFGLLLSVKQIYVEGAYKVCPASSTHTLEILNKLNNCTNLDEFFFYNLALLSPEEIQASIDEVNSQQADWQEDMINSSKEFVKKYAGHSETTWQQCFFENYARVAFRVPIPMMIITTTDDPLFESDASEVSACLKNSNIHMVRANCGSHCIYQDKILQFQMAKLNWSEGLSANYFKSLLPSQ